MRSWLKEIDIFLLELIRLDGRAERRAQLSCSSCLQGEPRYRCRDCLGGSLHCQTCAVKFHNYNPFHYVEVCFSIISTVTLFVPNHSKFWNGAFFERVTLKSLGCRIQLGHSIGEPCPLPSAAYDDSFVIIDSSGIHDVGLDFCGCGTGGTMVQQLLRFRLYPATVHNPNTAATFRALHHFQLLSFESKCSVYEYYQTLSRESDNTGLRKVKVSYWGSYTLLQI